MRCYRDLKWIIQGGGYHDPELRNQPGGLAVFCPNCPQPGINVVRVRPGDPDWLLSLWANMDGNFKMEGTATRNPAMDVWLRDGSGFMTNHTAFQEYYQKTEGKADPVGAKFFRIGTDSLVPAPGLL